MAIILNRRSQREATHVFESEDVKDRKTLVHGWQEEYTLVRLQISVNPTF